MGEIILIEVSNSDQPGIIRPYDVAIAIMPTVPIQTNSAMIGDRDTTAQSVPGFEDTRGGRASSERRDNALIERGEQAVAAAADAVAGQIGTVVARIAKAVEHETALSLDAESPSVESVEVSFGITLTAGLTTVFTAQGGSSVQVTVTLCPSKNQGTEASK